MNSFIGKLKKIGFKNTGLRSLLAVLILACGVNNAMAGVCTYTNLQPQIEVNQSFTVQQDFPVGMTLSSTTYQQYKVAENCDGQYNVSRLANTATYPQIGNNTTFKSGVEGVGIRVTIGPYELSTINFRNSASGDGTSPVYIQDIEVEFVKTGDITPGRMTAGKIGTVQMHDDAGTKDALTINIGSVEVKQASCEIVGGSAAIPVSMGKVMIEDFHGINSTLMSKDINIPLQCSAGTRVNINFDALSSLGNGIIDLAAGGAEGVGIQLKLNSVPVKFNKTLLVAEATQQGTFAIPLQAAYIQTADKMKTGLVNAVANFTVTYQ
uniref:fimbrial protein n=1 Tax=Scandinavium goeteborgense TaxID=1851514 RepID=UPI00135B39D5|nr:fimbrial protein [Scandinavium goeteborgense]